MIFYKSCVTIAPEYANSTLNSLNQKRDVCDNQAISSITQGTLSILESISNGGNLKQLFQSSFGSSTISLLGSVFGFKSPTMCELNQKIDLILVKLDQISNEIKIIGDKVECTSIKQDYRNEIAKKSEHLLNQFKQYEITHLKQEAKKSIIETCMHRTEGISTILSSFYMLLKNENVIDEFKYCCHYQKQKADKWALKIRQFSILFVLIVGWCEDAYGYETDFDPHTFIQDVEKRVNYHLEFTLLESFVNDPGSNGLENAVLNVLKENQDSCYDKLKHLYGFFDWDVIQYSRILVGFEQHAAIRSTHPFYGGMHYIRIDGLKRNAFVMWCLAGKVNLANFHRNSIIETIRNLSAGDSLGVVERIWDSYNIRNSDLIFVLCIMSPPHVDNELKICGEKNAFASFYLQTWNEWIGPKDCICFMSSSFYKSVDAAPTSVRSNYAIHFLQEKNDLLRTESLKLNKRLFGHYKHINVASARKCRQVCLKDKECVATSFAKPELNWFSPCFLFKTGYHKGDEEGWISYFL
jgi:hypothetical protein